MHVHVDEDRCQATGLCEALAPQVFRLGDEIAEVTDGADVAAHADDVAAAVESCPMEALRTDGPASEPTPR